ncbi:acyltransferase [Modestobacter marinus]|uniref:Acyltransferase n=1 Tax=Modestobacter marinus TaxID=477641 RepID=A0A846LM43_9ACTN|nr:acyltransferase [Modestobacter marinus]NIH67604.1 peptidoglycan/LPS O-acetylase OafA/YrhL [Modestobacter marinus]GGL72814.1 acyltransferase [Modestobacter marinus]
MVLQQAPARPHSETPDRGVLNRGRPQQAGPSRLRALDGLRLLAALSVAVYHYLAYEGAAPAWGQAPSSLFPQWSGAAAYGWLGVEVFFVISGFVICMSCWGRSLGDFFRSRVTRLYPAYWAAVVLTTVVVTVTPAIGQDIPFTDVLVNLTMLQDAVGADRVDGVYWTLWVELRFYLLFALLVWGGLTFRRVLAFSLIWTVVAALARTADSELLTLVAMPKYAPYFLVGIGIYLVHRFGDHLLSWLVIGVNAILSYHYAVLRMDHQAEDVVHQPLSRLIVGLVLFGGIALVAAIARGHLGWVRWRWVSYAGALTYPFYLLHDYIGFALINWLYDRVGVSAYAVLPVTVTAMLVLAWLVHRLAEKPLARWLKVRLTSGAMTLDPRDLLSRRRPVPAATPDAATPGAQAAGPGRSRDEVTIARK